MFDLFVPENVYSKEVAKKKLEISKIEENRELNNTRKKKEKERINAMIEKVFKLIQWHYSIVLSDSPSYFIDQ